MRSRVDLDAQRHAAVHRHRQRLRAAHAAEAGGERDRPGQRAAEAAPRDLGEALVGALQDALACRCRSTSPRSSARTSSARASSSRRNSSHVAHSGTRFELAISTRGAHSCVRNTPTGLPDCTSSVSSSSSVAQRAHDRVERLPRARRPAGAAVDDEVVRALGDLGVEVVHQHPQRGLLRPALAGQLGAARRADRRAARSSPAPRSPPRRRRAARPSRPARSAAASSGASQRSGPGPGDAPRAPPRSAAPVPGAGLQRRAQVERRAPRTTSSTARIRAQVGDAARSLRAAPQPIETWSSCIALVGSESTLAGAASRRFSATIAACVYWAIISPELTPGVGGEERRQARASASRRAAGRCAARRSRRPRRPRSRGSRRRSRAARRGSCRTTRRGRRAAPSGCRSPTRSSAPATALGVRERVARGAVHLRRAAQRVGVLHAVVAVAVAGDDRRAGEQRAQVRGAGRLAGLRAQRDRGPRRRRGRCRAAPRPTSPRRRRPTRSSASRSCEREQQHAEHAVGAVDQREALLGAAASSGSMPGRARAPRPPGAASPSASSTSPSPISTSAQCASGARSPLAPERAVLGHDRRDAGVEQREHRARRPPGRAPEQPIASVRARSSIIARTTSRSTGGAHAGGVRADQRALQLLAALGRDRDVGQRAEAGRDAVDGLGASRPAARRRRRSPPSPPRASSARLDAARPARATATTSSGDSPVPVSSTRPCSRVPISGPHDNGGHPGLLT